VINLFTSSTTLKCPSWFCKVICWLTIGGMFCKSNSRRVLIFPLANMMGYPKFIACSHNLYDLTYQPPRFTRLFYRFPYIFLVYLTPIIIIDYLQSSHSTHSFLFLSMIRNFKHFYQIYLLNLYLYSAFSFDLNHATSNRSRRYPLGSYTNRDV